VPIAEWAACDAKVAVEAAKPVDAKPVEDVAAKARP